MCKSNLSLLSTNITKSVSKRNIKKEKLIFKNTKEYKKSKCCKKFLTLKKKNKNKKFPLFYEDTVYKKHINLLQKNNKKIKIDLDLDTDDELLIKTEKQLVSSLKKGIKKYKKRH